MKVAPNLTEKDDKLKPYLTGEIKGILFDELAEDFLEQHGLEFMKGVPVPLKARDTQPRAGIREGIRRAARRDPRRPRRRARVRRPRAHEHTGHTRLHAQHRAQIHLQPHEQRTYHSLCDNYCGLRFGKLRMFLFGTGSRLVPGPSQRF